MIPALTMQQQLDAGGPADTPASQAGGNKKRLSSSAQANIALAAERKAALVEARKASRKVARERTLRLLQEEHDNRERQRKLKQQDKARRKQEQEAQRLTRKQQKKKKRDDEEQAAAAAAAAAKRRRVGGDTSAAAAAGGKRKPRDDSTRPRVVPSLGRPHRVVVVGAGFAGLGAALELQKHGIEVVVVEVSGVGFLWVWFLLSFCWGGAKRRKPGEGVGKEIL